MVVMILISRIIVIMVIVTRETVYFWFSEKVGNLGAIKHKLPQEGLRRRRHWQCCWKVKDTDKTDGAHWSDHLVLQTECTSKSSVPIAAIGREKEEIWAVSVFFVYKSVPISKNRNFASFGGAILFSCQSQRQELRKIEGYFFICFYSPFPFIFRLRFGKWDNILNALESR